MQTELTWLLESNGALTDDLLTATEFKGSPPDLTKLDGGCAFRPRCRFAIDKCATDYPKLESVGEKDHLAACFRSAEVAAARENTRESAA